MVSYDGAREGRRLRRREGRRTARSETRSGTVKGKIAYMSPEQCRGAPVDRRSDLFSLGIVLWEMLTTERLFRRDERLRDHDGDRHRAIRAAVVAPRRASRPSSTRS